MSSLLDPRIGQLVNGQFYAFLDGYDQPEFRGSLGEVKNAIGRIDGHLHQTFKARCETNKQKEDLKSWQVQIRFEHPAWDEKDGIWYRDVIAKTKSEAIKHVRSMAQGDGHIGGKGRYWLTATSTPDE